jgi:cell division septum initiation protein DivIVA
VKDIRAEIDEIRTFLNKNTNYKKNSKLSTNTTFKNKKKFVDKNMKKEKRIELKELTKDIKKREQKIVKNILKNTNIVLCTCIGASSYLLKDMEFDLTGD